MNSLMAISFHSLLQYSILEVNTSMFKRRLDSHLECWLDCCLASRDGHVGIWPKFGHFVRHSLFFQPSQ